MCGTPCTIMVQTIYMGNILLVEAYTAEIMPT